MLPHESLLRSVAYHQKKDKDLGQTHDLGTANRMAIYIIFLCLGLTIMLPVPKWPINVVGLQTMGVWDWKLFYVLLSI